MDGPTVVGALTAAGYTISTSQVLQNALESFIA